MAPPAPGPLATPLAWQLVAEGYTSDLVPFFERFAAEALRLAGLRPGDTVLDVAAGPGTLALLAARQARVSAIDFAAAMVERLEARALERGLSVDARVGDGMSLPYPDASFDAAFSMFGLIFFPQPQRGLRELQRVLRPGGRAVVSSWVPMDRVPLLAELFGALRAELPQLPFGEGRAPLGEPAEVRAELAAAGFTDVAVHEVTHALEVPTMREFVASAQRSNAPLVLLGHTLGEARGRALGEALLERLEQRFGRGPQRVEMTALLGFGRRPG